MSMLNEIRAKMNEALKAGDKETKQVYSSILNALTGKANPDIRRRSGVFDGVLQ